MDLDQWWGREPRRAGIIRRKRTFLKSTDIPLLYLLVITGFPLGSFFFVGEVNDFKGFEKGQYSKFSFSFLYIKPSKHLKRPCCWPQHTRGDFFEILVCLKQWPPYVTSAPTVPWRWELFRTAQLTKEFRVTKMKMATVFFWKSALLLFWAEADDWCVFIEKVQALEMQTSVLSHSCLLDSYFDSPTRPVSFLFFPTEYLKI